MSRFDPSKLIAARTRAGLSREQVAVAVCRSYESISFYERGHVKPPTPVIERLAGLFGIRAGDLFDDEAEIKPVGV